MLSDEVSDSYPRKLYERLCKGDQQAGRELVDMYSQRLFSYIRRKCIFEDVHEAEDCLQNTWEKLVMNCGKQMQEKNFWVFLCAIARNQSIDSYRKQNRKKRNPGDLVEYQEGYHQPDVLDAEADPQQVIELLETELEEASKLQAYKEVVMSLPDKQRLALTLQLSGYSLKEIARQMGEKNETVKSCLRYARNKLKQALS